MRLSRFAFLLPMTLLACGAGEQTAQLATNVSPLVREFAVSATRNHVPTDLLLAIAITEGGLEMPAQREVDPDATIPVAGPLQLRHGKLDTLARGAALMRVSELELRKDSALALEAGARVLAELGHKYGATDELSTWQPAVMELSGYADEAHRRDYAQRVYATLASGGTFAARDEERVQLAPHLVPAELLAKVDLAKIPDGVSLDETRSGPEYTGAEWIPTSCTNKCTPTRSGNPVQFVLIHDTEGGWDASVSTLQNDPNKSCHYIIGTDGRLGQFVHESVTAWHAGNFWYNQRSVGIEHVGYSTKPYTEKQYAKSAELLSYLTKKYSVPKDRAHIIGHDQVPNGTKISESGKPCSDSPKECEANTSYGGAGHHTDPGVWEWCTYMPRFGGTCKCNDIWELWNCSYDKTKAFRCVGGKIELETCDGPGACEVKALGTPDVCNKAVAPTDDAGVDSGVVDTGVPSSNDTGTSPADTGPVTPAADEAHDSAGCGCNTTPVPVPVGAVLALVATLAALGLSRRR
jgi:uncharacterized protein (TIGR03382 family)